MSKASEWAHGNDSAQVRPSLALFYRTFWRSRAVSIEVARVADDGGLILDRTYFDPTQAVTLANWPLATFAEPTP